MTTPSPSPPISPSPPSAGERLTRCIAPLAHSSPLPMPSPLLPSSGCPTYIQTLRIASTQALIDAVTATLPLPLLPPLPPSLYIPLPVDRRDDIPESEPTRGRGIDYGFVSTVDAEERRQGIRDVRVTELAELHEHDIHDLYALLEDAQDSRSRISQRVDMDSQRIVETLRVIRDMRRETSDMQTELLALREQQRRARQPGPEARIPDHQDASGDVDSHI
ncbi:hypothetical protein Tco_0422701 [Tanacetum coccineum]